MAACHQCAPVIKHLQMQFGHGEAARRMGVVSRCRNGCAQELLESLRQQLGVQPHRCPPIVMVEYEEFTAERILGLIQEACDGGDRPFLGPGVRQAVVALLNWPSSIPAIEFTRKLVALAQQYAPGILLLKP